MLCRHQIPATETECQYSPSHWCNRPHNLVIDEHIEVIREHYERIRRCIPVKLDVAYGETAKQKVDIWGVEDSAEDAVILFHGGYWIAEDRKDFTAPVKPLVDNGYVVACVGYEYATDGRSLQDCVVQAAKALLFLQNRWTNKRLCAGGFCAGAHLVCLALNLLPENHHYDKLLLISTICQLDELPETYIGRDINLSAEDAKRLSIKQFPNFHGSVLVLYGSMDTPKFIEQNGNLIKMLKQLNISVTSKMVIGEDHFSLNHSFAEESSIAMATTLDFLRS